MFVKFPPDYSNRSTSDSGFTLIELLVVISIISLLVSILLPALASARQSAQAVKCLSRQHQVGIASAMYRNEFNSYYPVNYMWGGMYPPYGSDTYRYANQIAPYLNMAVGGSYSTSDMDLYDTNATNRMMCPANGWVPYDGVGGFAKIREYVNTNGNYAIWNYDTPVQFGHGFWDNWDTFAGHDYRPKKHEPTQPSRFMLSTETAGLSQLGYISRHLADVQYYHPNNSANILLADGHAARFEEGKLGDLGYTYLTD